MTIKETGPARAHSTRPARPGRRYPSDLSSAEWAVIEPLLPGRSRRGRPLVHSRRVIVNAILYVNRTGCAWRYLPKDFPPWRTVYGYFAAWRDNGVLQRIHDQLRDAARTAAGRDPQPTAAVIDSQSVRAADTVPKASRGWDNAKKTSDAVDVSSRPGGTGLPCRGEGRVLVEACALGQAVMKAADHAVEEVALGGCVRVSGFAAPVVVSSRSG